MRRRDLMKSVVLAASSISMATRSQAHTPASADAPKVVYHLSDVQKASYALGNIRNHIDGMGGPEHVVIALVVNGPALRLFSATAASDPLRSEVERLSADGVKFFACVHTMQGMNLELGDLSPGFEIADKGGVVKLAMLQAEGWAYIRP